MADEGPRLLLVHLQQPALAVTGTLHRLTFLGGSLLGFRV